MKSPKLHPFHSLLFYEWLIVKSFSSGFKEGIGQCCSCRRKGWLSQTRWVDSAIYKIHLYIGNFLHAYQPISVKIFLIWNAIFEGYFAVQSMSQTVNNASFYLLVRAA